jgi:ABC-type uncharacterized transport system ATPase subunit
MDRDSAELSVRMILNDLGLVVTDEEMAALVSSYSSMRELTAELYAQEFADEEPVLGFDPALR